MTREGVHLLVFAEVEDLTTVRRGEYPYGYSSSMQLTWISLSSAPA